MRSSKRFQRYQVQEVQKQESALEEAGTRSLILAYLVCYASSLADFNTVFNVLCAVVVHYSVPGHKKFKSKVDLRICGGRSGRRLFEAESSLVRTSASRADNPGSNPGGRTNLADGTRFVCRYTVP